MATGAAAARVEEVPPEQPYGSLDALLKAEIGHTQAEAEGVLRQRGRPKKDEEKGDTITFSRGTTGKAYLTARLRRDAPETLAALARGEYRSVRQAALAAGIVRERTPLTMLEHWWQKASATERTAFAHQDGVYATIAPWHE